MQRDFKKLLTIVLVYGILFILFFSIKNTSYDVSKQISAADTSDVNLAYDQVGEDDQVVEGKIYIHLSGQVNYPGLIILNPGSRLYEAIDIAGGMTEYADIDQINLAQILEDQDKIYIPKIGETKLPSGQVGGQEEYININTASKEDLMKLSGIGEKTAQNIIDYRAENRFNEIEDIMKVPGIGQGKFDQIKEQIIK